MVDYTRGKQKFCDLCGIRTHDHLIGLLLVNWLSLEARLEQLVDDYAGYSCPPLASYLRGSHATILKFKRCYHWNALTSQ